MKVIEIRNLQKNENHLHYRNEFTGELVYESHGSFTDRKPLAFTIERHAVGAPMISVSFPNSIEYPLIPAKKRVKDFIIELDRRGQLV